MDTSLLNNRILIAAFLAWAIAQVSKTIYELIRQRKLIVSRLVSSGGMPSSHSALVTGLAAATGRVSGFGSAPFAIAVVLAAIVMYDAAGVRRAVSIQARILNQMIDEAFQGHPIAEIYATVRGLSYGKSDRRVLSMGCFGQSSAARVQGRIRLRN